MHDANAEAIRRYFEAANRRDFEAAMSAYDDEVVLVVSDSVVGIDAATYRGREAVGQWFGDWFRAFAKDYRLELGDVVADRGRVVAVVHHHARGRTSGVEVEARWANAFWLRDGKIVRVELYDRIEAALAAAGLSVKPSA